MRMFCSRHCLGGYANTAAACAQRGTHSQLVVPLVLESVSRLGCPGPGWDTVAQVIAHPERLLPPTQLGTSGIVVDSARFNNQDNCRIETKTTRKSGWISRLHRRRRIPPNIIMVRN